MDLSPRRLALFTAVAVFAVGLASIRPMGVVGALIARGFPDVPRVGPEALAREMGGARPLLILDARSPAEFAVSHLHHAVRIDPEHPALTLPGDDRDRPVVVYCSVGYRSATVSRALRAAGYRNVRNLDGGIFAWANASHDVWRGDAVVREVHPYSPMVGRLLQR